MNNAEKFLEVFGFDLPIKYFCPCSNNEPRCEHCTDKVSCYAWATAEYKENKDV